MYIYVCVCVCGNTLQATNQPCGSYLPKNYIKEGFRWLAVYVWRHYETIDNIWVILLCFMDVKWLWFSVEITWNVIWWEIDITTLQLHGAMLLSILGKGVHVAKGFCQCRFVVQCFVHNTPYFGYGALSLSVEPVNNKDVNEFPATGPPSNIVCLLAVTW